MAPPSSRLLALISSVCLLLSYTESHASPDTTTIRQVVASITNKRDIYHDRGVESGLGNAAEIPRRGHHGYHEYDEPKCHDRHGVKEEASKPFVLDEPSVAVSTEAGEIRMLPKERSSLLAKNNVGLYFISLEPKALLLPHYINADCVLLVNTGKAKLSLVKNGEVQDIDLAPGDLYRIRGGTVFQLYNPDEGQRVHIFTIFDTSNVFQHGGLQRFFVAGGYDPKTVLSGFDDDVIATAMKVSRKEVGDFLNHQSRGPIIYSTYNTTGKESEKPWQFGSMLRKFLFAFVENSNKPYNILKKSPDFKSENGRTVTVNGKDSDMLKKADLGVFVVSLKAGALLAPHWNPRASEIGVVTKGEGIIQIAFPNGTNALNKKVGVGNLFFVPQYHPMCQIASRSGEFEFMGFSTSARRNHPQFLAGNNSVLRALNVDILATAFDTNPDILKDLLESQQDAVLLPGRVEEPRHA